MAKNMNKSLALRLDGMRYALDVAKTKGIDELEKDIKRRTFSRAPISIDAKELEDFQDFVCQNLHMTVLTMALAVLKDVFGFGPKRMQQFADDFQKKTIELSSLDWMGERYVTFEDFEKDLQKKHNFGIDVKRLGMCQESADKSTTRFGWSNMDRILEELEKNGFKDAAAFLKAKRREKK